MLGIIGGSGFYELFEGREDIVQNPFGEVRLVSGKLAGKQAFFIARHRRNHSLPPHKVNYKANLFELKRRGVTCLVCVNACGVISSYKPGDLVLARDFIAPWIHVTFYDSFEKGARHTDVSKPYSPEINSLLKKAARAEKIRLKEGGIIATTFGPRFETAAEIRALKLMGANLVNMTSAYEAILASELGIPMSNILIAANPACGTGKKAPCHEEVVKAVKAKELEIERLISRFAGLV